MHSLFLLLLLLIFKKLLLLIFHNRKRLWSHAIKFAEWQHPAMEHGDLLVWQQLSLQHGTKRDILLKYDHQQLK